MNIVRQRKGEYIIKRGQQPENFIFILDGEIQMNDITEQQQPHRDIIGVFKKGGHLLEYNLIAELSSTYDYVCLEDCTLLVLRREIFQVEMRDLFFKDYQQDFNFFRNLPYLQNFSNSKIKKLTVYSQKKKYKKGECIYMEQDYSDSVHVIIGGIFTKFRRDGQGQNRPEPDKLFPQNIFGQKEIYMRKRRFFTVKCESMQGSAFKIRERIYKDLKIEDELRKNNLMHLKVSYTEQFLKDIFVNRRKSKFNLIENQLLDNQRVGDKIIDEISHNPFAPAERVFSQNSRQASGSSKPGSKKNIGFAESNPPPIKKSLFSSEISSPKPKKSHFSSEQHHGQNVLRRKQPALSRVLSLDGLSQFQDSITQVSQKSTLMTNEYFTNPDSRQSHLRREPSKSKSHFQLSQILSKNQQGISSNSLMPVLFLSNSHLPYRKIKTNASATQSLHKNHSTSSFSQIFNRGNPSAYFATAGDHPDENSSPTKISPQQRRISTQALKRIHLQNDPLRMMIDKMQNNRVEYDSFNFKTNFLFNHYL